MTRAQARVNADPELKVIGGWFTVALSLTSGDRRAILRFEGGRLIDVIGSPRLDVRCAFGFRASPEIWTKFFAKDPEPLYHDFFAMLMRVPGFVLEGDTLVAMQHARALHRAMNVMRFAHDEDAEDAEDAEAEGAKAAARTDVTKGAQRLSPAASHGTSASSASSASSANVEPIVGRYLNLHIGGVAHRVFVEEAGEGIPLLCLHTAGADSRQYRHLLNDSAITRRYRVVAFDLPYHGRSNPPDGWWLRKYQLNTADYLAIIRAVWDALDLVRPVVIGGSMGGAIVLKLAAEYQQELRGIIGLESSAFAPGRDNDYLHHPRDSRRRAGRELHLRPVRAEEPGSERARELVVLQPVRPGVYAGDVHYYSVDWDGREDITRIDTSVCKVSLLTGQYDYSCTPDMTRAVAKAIRGSRLVIMEGMGHFPMIENYPVFRESLLPELEFMASRSG